MVSYSNSRINTFDQCKLKFKLQYIDKIKVDIPNTIEAFMGDLVHRALEKLYSDLKFKLLNSKEDVIKYYYNLWEKEYTTDILIAKKHLSEEHYKQLGEQFISMYYDEHQPFDQMNVVDLETKDKLTLPDGNQYHIRIDKLGFVEDTFYVCDYKTSSRMKSQSEADSDAQLAMYSLWVRKNFKNAKKVILKWYMLAFNKVVTSERTEEELLNLQDKIVQKIKVIENTVRFPPTMTPLCNYCVFQEVCPSLKQKQEEKIAMEHHFGKTMVDALHSLTNQKQQIDSEIGKIKDRLIEYSQKNKQQVVLGSNTRAEIVKDQKISYPKDKKKFIELVRDVYSDVSIVNVDNQLLLQDIEAQLSDKLDIEISYDVKLE